MEASPPAVTATRTRTASVTGVKIAGANLSGHYTVQVQTTGDWITVREGELSGNEQEGVAVHRPLHIALIRFGPIAGLGGLLRL